MAAGKLESRKRNKINDGFPGFQQAVLCKYTGCSLIAKHQYSNVFCVVVSIVLWSWALSFFIQLNVR